MANLISQIFGHETASSYLVGAIQKQQLAHANLFSGPSGIGKKRVAQALAQILICPNRQDPSKLACGVCGSCARVERGTSESVLLISPSKGQIRVDEASRVREFLSLQTPAPARAVIIDDAETLNPQAANMLLKILEEPPANCFFFIISSSAQDVLPTIRSRAQHVVFSALSFQELKKILPTAPDWILKSSFGQVTHAQFFLDTNKSEVRSEALLLLEKVLMGSLWDLAKGVRDVLSDRENALEVLGLWQMFVRDALVANTNPESIIHQDLSGPTIEFLRKLDHNKLHELFQRLLQAETDIRSNVDRTLSIENIWLKQHSKDQ